MAVCRPTRGLGDLWFQSPSRGGHLRGHGDEHLDTATQHVSVPFTRGTPPWQRRTRANLRIRSCFSPLHEGDTSVAKTAPNALAVSTMFQSPSRGGHLRGRYGRTRRTHALQVSVPFTRGTPPWLCRSSAGVGRLGVSVPFTRGTPPWLRYSSSARPRVPGFSPLHEGDTSVASEVRGLQWGDIAFQSPSRGGHLRGVCRRR